MSRILPTEKLPAIDVGLVGGGRWRLAEHAPKALLMIDVYRGGHCPRCRRHLEALSATMADFAALGVEVIALSADPAERAQRSQSEWAVPNLTLGYGLPVALAQRLGCYVSKSLKPEENEVFAEPGVFFVQPDLTLYGAVVGSFPFARPNAADLFEVAKIKIERNAPPRGSFRA